MQALGANARLQSGGLELVAVPTGEPAVGHTLQPQTRRSARQIENNHIARINEVRILHQIAIDAPDIRPLPWIFEKPSRNTPQRVAALDGITGRRIVLQLDIACWLCGS